MNTLEAMAAAKAEPGACYELSEDGIEYRIKYMRIGNCWRIVDNGSTNYEFSPASILPESDGWVRKESKGAGQ